MQPANKFCTQCGKPLAPNARFCGACGSPIRTLDPPAAPEPQGNPYIERTAPPQPVMQRPPFVQQAAPIQTSAPVSYGASQTAGETILTMIPGIQRRKGVLGMSIDSFTLIATPTRLIFAYLDNKTMNAFVNEARQNAKGQGKGWLGQVAAQMGWVNLMLEHFEQMGPDTVLAQYPGSFVIPNNSVSRVSIKQRYSQPGESDNPIEITFDTTAGKQKFHLPPSMGIHQREIKQRLQRVLGAAVR